MEASTFCLDHNLWPPGSGCGGKFDFTLLFEQGFLSLLPSAALSIAATVRIVQLKSARRKVGGRKFQIIKLYALVLYAAVQLALLVLWSSHPAESTKISVPAATVSLINAIICSWLSYVEHGKSLQPSSVLGIYFFFSCIFDAAQVRTLWLNRYPIGITASSTVSFSIKAVIVILEAWEKKRFLLDTDENWSPEETSSIFNRSIFFWLDRLLLLGFRKRLSFEDLYPLDTRLDSYHLHTRFKEYWSNASHHGKRENLLLRTLLRCYAGEFLASSIPRLLLIGFTFCQPLLLNRTLEILQQRSQADISNGLIGAYVAVYFGLAISAGLYWYRQFRCLAMIRGSLVAMIYQKTLEITDGSGGLTLMSTDIEQIITGFRYLHEIWANLIEIVIGVWLLEEELGVASIAPVIIAVLCSIATMRVNSFAAKCQVAWMNDLQERVATTAAILSSAKIAKMVGVSAKLNQLIQGLRVREVKSAHRVRMVIIGTLCIAFGPKFLSPVVTFGIFISTNQDTTGALDASKVFASLSLLVILSTPFSQLFQLGPLMIAAMGCLKRIKDFLNQSPHLDKRLLLGNEFDEHATATSVADVPELRDALELRNRKTASLHTWNKANHDKCDFVVQGAAFAWPSQDPVLQNVNLRIPQSGLTIVTGPTASGKTTLCKALLGEAAILSGTVQVNSSPDIAVCHQQPFLFNASLRENIIAFSTPDLDWYNSVIGAVGLRDDINALTDGDSTLVGSNGIALSGGQKQRVAIARAVYAGKRIVFFDDIFRGLDNSTEKLVFEKLFGSTGLLRMQGTTAVLFTHDTRFLPMADHIILIEDSHVYEGTYDDLLPRSSYLQGSMVSTSEGTYARSDGEQSSPAPDVGGASGTSSTSQNDLDCSQEAGILALFKYYFSAVGMGNTIILFTLATCLGVFNTFPSIWLTWWTNAGSQGTAVDTGRYIGIYAILQILGLVSVGAFFYHAVDRIAVSSGITLHHSILNAVISATLAFYTRTDIGYITNRFSQDMELIDAELPRALMNLIMNLFIAIGQVILITVAAPFVAISFPVILLVLSAIQRFYIRTSSRLRILNLETKSPLYTHFLETTSGISTTRPFGWHAPYMDRCYQRLDASQRPFYLLFMVQQWLSFVLDTVSALLAILVIILVLKAGTNSGFTGVGLVNLISLNSTLRSIITCWALSETSIGAVSRIRSLEKSIKPEEKALDKKTVPAEDWPSCGKIEIKGLTASYDVDAGVDVLKNVDMVIRPGEKIGICGRTGSGKSSLLLALLHMIELRSGKILIDDIDISDIARNTLRTRLNTVPQESFFLPGSVRLNLDPSESPTVSTDDMITALREVQLWTVIELLGGLDAEMKSDILSHGQQQLFCLARALLHPEKKIILMDEATSSLDVEIDSTVQRVIRERFQGHTIIAIAHRATVIHDFDRVAIFKDGELVEFDDPRVLARRERSLFKELLKARSDSEGER